MSVVSCLANLVLYNSFIVLQDLDVQTGRSKLRVIKIYWN